MAIHQQYALRLYVRSPESPGEVLGTPYLSRRTPGQVNLYIKR
jgi:hypothetical protein